MIGKLLCLYRFKNELNVRQMAQIIGVSASTISRIENGKSLDAETLIKLMNWLFGRAGCDK